MLENIIYRNPFILETKNQEEGKREPFFIADIPDINHKVQCFLRPGGKAFVISIGETVYNLETGEYGFSPTNTVTLPTSEINIMDESNIVEYLELKLG